MARVAILLLVACALRAQSVDGTLTDSVTQAPIPNVIVTLLGPVRYNDTTDVSGAFHFHGLRPGKYMWNIVKAGYVLGPAARKAFEVTTDSRIDVAMDPLGKVEGRVRYPDGRPAPRASVNLTGSGHNYTADADLGGNFLVEDVAAGSYALRAVAARGDPTFEGEIWAPTWFPSTTDRASAEPIVVRTGLTEHRDVRLRSVPARRIRGVVRDETGKPAAHVSVKLSGPLDAAAETAADGAFDLPAFDGAWSLAAARDTAKGYASVTVSRHDVENAEVRLALPFSLAVLVEGDRMELPLMLTREDGNGPMMTTLVAGAVNQNVYPGRYVIRPMRGIGGTYIESVKLGEAEVYGKPVDIWDGSVPIRITYAQGAATIRGAIESGENAAVAVMNQDLSNPLDQLHFVMAGPDGRFQLGGLRPGDYYVLAFDHREPSGTPDLLRPLIPKAEKVHLEKGGSVAVTLKLTPWPQ